MLNIGLDFHDTISYAPDFFINLIRVWKENNLGNIYIVTGTPPSKKHEVLADLEKIGLSEEDFKEILLGFEYEKDKMDLRHFKKMAKHKLKLLKKHNINIYFDDNPYYVQKMKDEGILTFQTMMSKDYLDMFEKADPFFTCNLQKEQFDYLDKLDNKKMCKKDDCKEIILGKPL